jgi:hypothetical protein
MVNQPTQKDLDKQEIVIYQSGDGKASVDIKLMDDTLWLSLAQLADLFEKDKSVISRHLKNIFDTEELQQDSTVANFAIVQTEGNRVIERNIDHYNLDAIISVGYRVNSKRGTEFRKWSSQILKDYLIKDYSLNQQQLDKKSILELRQTIDLLSKTMINQNLTTDIGIEVIHSPYAQHQSLSLRTKCGNPSSLPCSRSWIAASLCASQGQFFEAMRR